MKKLVLLLTAFGLSAFAPAATVTVHMFDFEFSINPSTGPVVDPTINVGDTIHWVCDDGVHTTTSVVGQADYWQSEVMFAGDTFDHTFNTAGSFNYFCEIHGYDNGMGMGMGMAGTINVVPEPTALISLAAGASLLCLRRRRKA